MQLRKLFVCALLLLSARLPAGYAQQLDPQQIGIIKDAASSICNTVKDVKGEKTDVQIQGEVRGQLSGLVGRLANAGGSASGSLNRDEFEGLTQSATAIALAGDRECRERLFSKMFDSITFALLPPAKPKTTLTILPITENMGSITIGSKSGSLAEGSGQTFGPIEIGQTAEKRQVRGFISFDLSQIPQGSQIVKAKLKCVMGGRSGSLDPNFFSTVLIETVSLDNFLDGEDFYKNGTLVKTVSLESFGSAAQDVTDAVVLAVRNRQEFITFRLRFSVAHSNMQEQTGWAIDDRGRTFLQVELQ